MYRRPGVLIVTCTACTALLALPVTIMAESPHVFGVHNWDWGVNVDVMNFVDGWVTEANLGSESPNVGGRYAPMVAEGFTIIQRLDWKWEETMPVDPANYPVFAAQCANNWANNIKNYCRHYLIGNEVDLTSVTPAQYATCFVQVRNAIKAVQPDALVLVGQWTNGANVRTVLQLLGRDGYDGVTAHTSNHVPDDLLDLLDDPTLHGAEGSARPGVGVYISEWGWVAGTNPNAQSVMLQFCQEVHASNASRDRQVYAATWYRYPSWDPTFSLESSPIDNAAFENMMVNCAAANSYIENAVTISNPRVQVSTTGKSLIARWETDVPARTMLWYWNPLANQRNGEFRPLDTSLVTEHQITMDDPIHVAAQTEYRMICRSPAKDIGNGNAGPLLVTTGPWTINVSNITPDSATISWTTLFAGSSKVEFGPTAGYGEQIVNPTPTTSHVVHLQNLAPMTDYHFRVWSEAPGYAPHHSGDRTFSTTVPPGPFISVWPLELSATAQALTNPPDTSFTIRNAGDGTINYTVTPQCGWLSAAPDTGSSQGETDTITVSFDTSGLLAGEHTCEFSISAPEAVNSPVLAPKVTLTLWTVPADFDGDGDVDLEDFGHLQACFNSSGVQHPDPGCLNADLDDDGDVDPQDYAIFRNCLGGSNRPPAPDCAD